MKFLVKAELQTTPERAWGFYFDPTFNLELRKVMNVESLDEHEFVETDANPHGVPCGGSPRHARLGAKSTPGRQDRLHQLRYVR